MLSTSDRAFCCLYHRRDRFATEQPTRTVTRIRASTGEQRSCSRLPWCAGASAERWHCFMLERTPAQRPPNADGSSTTRPGLTNATRVNSSGALEPGVCTVTVHETTGLKKA
jgi:hypothetical protein